ncbi:hypothetical protein SAMN02982929_02989 [Saccharopolyspora kobensis]|uniref:Uncharacterized protein n=1 Tax=Saccharopolyspora kobensis TaxID=146035 RepID=A0A1H6BZT0_9PSEU|nr:hypothetical protein [Saccharopolyspora kobensis]SEG66219.1 hypothetical protein SAMN02982929_02989 [Saccharopolyspora kobensis]SFC22405.1 hypothetical protein SAMN05216506_101228 [Saccharopolyspora kobensis]
MSGTPESQLAPRWRRGRTQLLIALAVLPLLVTGICAALAAIAMAAGTGPWAALPAAGALVAAAIQIGWLVRSGGTDPSSALKVAFTAGGATVLVGLIPSAGMAGGALGGALVALGLALVAVSCVLAARGHRTMLQPLVPELGSMPVRLRIATRFAMDSADLVSSSLVIDLDRIEWTARRHRANGGPRVDVPVPFHQLRGARPIVLPTAQPWLSLPDGTVLHAPAGPAVVLSTAAGERMVPVHDAALLVALLERRVARWQRAA